MIDHTSFAKDQLVEILFALSGIQTPVIENDRAAEDDSFSVATRTQAEFVDIKADRLLGPPRTGALLTQEEVRARLFAAMSVLPGPEDFPRNVWERISRATVDFMIASGASWDTNDTYERAWRHVMAVCDAAQAHAMSPVRFIGDVSQAHDWVVRLASSPQEYRELACLRLDRMHPDEIGRHLQALASAIKRATQDVPGLEEIPVVAAMPYRVGDDYWKWRAQMLQQVEREIARIWSAAASD